MQVLSNLKLTLKLLKSDKSITMDTSKLKDHFMAQLGQSFALLKLTKVD